MQIIPNRTDHLSSLEERIALALPIHHFSTKQGLDKRLTDDMLQRLKFLIKSNGHSLKVLSFH